MKTLYISLVIFVLIFAVIHFQTDLGLDLPDWVTFYVKDFLSTPIALTLGLIVAQLIKGNRRIRLSLFTIFSLTIMYVIFYEVYLPRVHSRYTADLIDVFMYFGGSFLFYALQGKGSENPTLIEEAETEN